MGIAHDKHSLIIENSKQEMAIRRLVFMLWNLQIIKDDSVGYHIFDELEDMVEYSQQKADKCL